MPSSLMSRSFSITCILTLLCSICPFTVALEPIHPSLNNSDTSDLFPSLLQLPNANGLPQPPNPFVIYDPGNPPRTRVEFTGYSRRISVQALSEALISCFFGLAKRAVRNNGDRPFKDFYRFSNDGVAIVVRSHEVPGKELTIEVMTDVLWAMWTFANQAVLCSARFTVQWEGT